MKKDSKKPHYKKTNGKVIYDNETLQGFIKNFVEIQGKRDRRDRLILGLLIFAVVLNTMVMVAFILALYRIDQHNLLNQILQSLSWCRAYGFIKTGMVIPG